MARSTRLHLPGGLYHVMLRGNGGQPIFRSDGDRARFEALIADGVQRFGHRIHGYCWMENHVHMAAQVGETPLSRIMQNLSFRYTQWFNHSEGRSGHLFQGRYKAILVDADAYLLELIRYIHLNPVRAGRVKAASQYRWSGHRGYLGLGAVSWLTTDWVLSQFADDVLQARRAYVDFVGTGKNEGFRKDLHGGNAQGRLLGGDDFVERTLAAAREEPPSPVSIDTVVDVVCAHLSVDARGLSSRDRGRAASRARTWIAYLVVETDAATLASVANRFERNISTLSNAVSTLRQRCREDNRLSEELDELAERVFAFSK